MANVICNDEFCESTSNKEDNSELTFGQKATIIVGSAVFAVVLGTIAWYGAVYYPVPMS